MRRNSFTPRGVVSLEEENLAAAAAAAAVDGTAPAADPIGDNSDSLETQLLEASEVEAEIVKTEDAIEDGASVAAALEEIAETLVGVAENGGLEAGAAQALTIGVDSMYERVGLEPAVNSMPATESFGTASSRVQATQLVMEELKQKAVEIWKAIVAQIQRAYEWVIDFVSKVWTGAERLKKRAAALKKAAADLPDSAKPEATEITDARLATAVSYGGKVADLPKHTAAMATFTSVLLSNNEDFYDVVADTIAAAGSDPKGFLEKLEIPSGAEAKEGKQVANPKEEGFPVPSEGLAVYRSEELLGSRAIVTVAPKATLKGQAAAAVLGEMKSAIVPFNSKKAAEAAKLDKLPVLSKEEAEKVAANVETMAGNIEKWREGSVKMRDKYKKLIADTKKITAKAENATAEEKAEVTAVKSAILASLRTLGAKQKVYVSYALNTGSQVCHYVEKSLKAHKAPKAAAAPAAA